MLIVDLVKLGMINHVQTSSFLSVLSDLKYIGKFRIHTALAVAAMVDGASTQVLNLFL